MDSTWPGETYHLSFKHIRSRSLVLKKGKVVDKFCFLLFGITIPSITEKPIKSFAV